MFELERKKFQRQRGELWITNCRLPAGNQFAQARGEAGEVIFHAVFVHGWFSATASLNYSSNFTCRN